MRHGLQSREERRWRTKSSRTLNNTVEERFSFACEQVKNRNITVWVISFGVKHQQFMQDCAGADRYFVADDAAELSEAFASIAKRMGELRVTR